MYGIFKDFFRITSDFVYYEVVFINDGWKISIEFVNFLWVVYEYLEEIMFF